MRSGPLGSSAFEEAERRLMRGQRRMRSYGPEIGRPRSAGISEEAENALIEKNKQDQKALGPHAFRRAQWTLEDGRERCLTCGDPARLDPDREPLSCEGISKDSSEQTEAKPEAGPTDGGDPSSGTNGPSAQGNGGDASVGGAATGSDGGQPDGGGADAGAHEQAPADGEAEVSPVIVKYSEGVMHAHVGASTHFHEVRKNADETGVATDTGGVELAAQHKHPVEGGVLKFAPALAVGRAVASTAARAIGSGKEKKSEVDKHAQHDQKTHGGDGAPSAESPASPASHAASGDVLDDGRGGGHYNTFRALSVPEMHSHLEAEHGMPKGYLADDLTPSRRMNAASFADEMHDQAHERGPAVTRKSLLDLANTLLAPQEVIKTYTVFKSENTPSSQRYTLGIAYPVDEIDAHGDYSTAEEVEKAAWRFARKGLSASGVQHRTGTGGAGEVVESYIYRGPEWQVGDQIVKAGTWLLGVVWDQPTWDAIQKGELQGFSIQGFAKRIAQGD